MSNTNRGLEKLKLEMYLAGELDEKQNQEVEHYLDHSPQGKEYFRLCMADKKQFLQTHPYQNLARKLKESSPLHVEKNTVSQPWETFTFISGQGFKFAVAMAMVVILAGLLIFQIPGIQPNSEMRTKGGVHFDYVYKDNGKVHKGRDGIIFEEGDEIQFRYTANDYSYVSLASLDVSGEVTVYKPPSADHASVAAEEKNNSYLPFSIKLDGSRGQETFFMFFSQEPLEDDEIKDWLVKMNGEKIEKPDWGENENLGSLPFSDTQVKSLVILKK